MESQNSEVGYFVARMKEGIWLLGVMSWMFGITDRSIAALADGMVMAIELVQLFTAALFFFCWLFLKPDKVLGL